MHTAPGFVSSIIILYTSIREMAIWLMNESDICYKCLSLLTLENTIETHPCTALLVDVFHCTLEAKPLL